MPQLPSHDGTRTAPKQQLAGTGDAAHAQAALADLAQRAHLDEDQLRRMKSAQAALARNDAAKAAAIAISLDDQVRRATTRYTTTADETLWSISTRIYHNSYLWPLIWQANRRLLPDPDALHSGQVLTIPTYPTLSQIADALQYAHTHTVAETSQDRSPPPKAGN